MTYKVHWVASVKKIRSKMITVWCSFKPSGIPGKDVNIQISAAVEGSARVAQSVGHRVLQRAGNSSRKQGAY